MTANLDEYLKQTALFAGFNDRQIDGVLAIAKERRFAAGETDHPAGGRARSAST